jgi:hypothetical protein
VRLGWLILLISSACLLLVAAASLLATQGPGVESLFLDVYELTGSRLTGLVSSVGVALLVASAAVCLFASRLLWPARWGRWLLGAGLLTALLALDDYLSIHELADDVLAPVIGDDAGRVVKNGLEAAVLGLYALAFVILVWRFRATVFSTEWLLLAIALAFMLLSLGLDFGPHTWLSATVGVSIAAQDVAEDTLKLLGIAFYATYFIRSSAQAVRTRLSHKTVELE